MDTAYCYASIFLGLAESRILPAASVNTSHLILHCPAMDSLVILSLYDLWEVAWLPESKVFRYAPIHRKGSGNQQQKLYSFLQCRIG